jgi:thioredoxin-like negative regulator of GroEL
MEPVYSLESIEEWIGTSRGVLFYFSNEMCSVCKVLKPRVSTLLKERFPLVRCGYIDTDKSPLLAGQHRVFTIPTILLFFEGKEQARFSRNISMVQLEEAISRPYSVVFGE